MPPIMQSGDIALYRRVIAYLKPYKVQFSLVVVAMVVTALAEPALAALVKPLLDGSFVEKDPLYIKYVPLALLGIATVRAVGGFAIGVGMNWVTEKVTLDIRDDVFAKLVRLPVSYYEQHSTGKIISYLLYHVDSMKAAATRTLVPLIKDSVTVLALLVWMIYLNWTLTLTILLLAPVIVFAMSRTSRRLRTLNRDFQNNVSVMMQTVEESVRNQKAVKVHVAQAHARRRASEMFHKLRRLGFKLAVASSANAGIIQILSAVALASVVYFSSLQSAQDQITVGGFVSFFGAMALLLSPIKRLAQINETLQRGLAAAESVFSVLDQVPEPTGGNAPLPKPDGRLEFRDVSFSYAGASEPTLSNISFSAGPNETVAIVGLSGSGKSTIAALIPLLHRPSSGAIFINGVDTRDIPIDKLREHVSFVSQDVLLFNDSIRDNIAFGGSRDASSEQVIAAADAANATEFIEHLPEGFDTNIGQAGVRLSGGQRQRIEIARAILKDAPIMVLDEATSALDTESERKVQRAIQHLSTGRTMIVIAHRLSTIESADKIVVIDNGAIAETGTHSELVALNGIYAKLYAIGKNNPKP